MLMPLRGTVGKTAVIGAKERESKKVKAKVIENTKRNTLHGFIEGTVEEGSTVNTDDFKIYEKLEGYEHRTVQHSVGEYVEGQIHINGMESFWSMLKRAHKGTYHKMSKKHLNRYVVEFAENSNTNVDEFAPILSRCLPGGSKPILKFNSCRIIVDTHNSSCSTKNATVRASGTSLVNSDITSVHTGKPFIKSL